MTPAVIFASAEPHAAGAVVFSSGLQCAFLQSRDRIDNFESRAGRIDSLDDAILQRMIRIGHQLFPRRRFHAAAKDVGVESRMRNHCEHVAVARIECDERAVLPGHRSLSGLLQIQVYSHDQAVAGRVGDFLEYAKSPPDRINFDLLPTRVAAQKTFPDVLETEFSDLVAHVVVRMRLEIVDRNLADVAEQMRGELAVQVVTRGRDLQTDAGQVELMRLERHDLLPSETLGDVDGLVMRASPFL